MANEVGGCAVLCCAVLDDLSIVGLTVVLSWFCCVRLVTTEE